MLNQDYRDMLLCLKEEGVDFIIVGAYALAAHGNPRATGDIDIWIRNTVENAKKVILALKKFGAPLAGLSANDFTVDDLILEIGVKPCRVDLITGIDGVAFKDAWENKKSVAVDGIDVNILSKSDLLKNKLAANRDKDRSDIAWLTNNQDADA